MAEKNRTTSKRAARRKPLQRIARVHELKRRLGERVTDVLQHRDDGATLLVRCKPGCPACEVEARVDRRYERLGRIQRTAEREHAGASEASIRSARQARTPTKKITRPAYEEAKRSARNKKQLASILGVSPRGLLKWEEREGISEPKP